jgi:hypothetical protein
MNPQLSQFSTDQLGAMAWKFSKELQKIQMNINVIEQELQLREQSPKPNDTKVEVKEKEGN